MLQQQKLGAAVTNCELVQETGWGVSEKENHHQILASSR